MSKGLDYLKAMPEGVSYAQRKYVIDEALALIFGMFSGIRAIMPDDKTFDDMIRYYYPDRVLCDFGKNPDPDRLIMCCDKVPSFGFVSFIQHSQLIYQNVIDGLCEQSRDLFVLCLDKWSKLQSERNLVLTFSGIKFFTADYSRCNIIFRALDGICIGYAPYREDDRVLNFHQAVEEFCKLMQRSHVDRDYVQNICDGKIGFPEYFLILHLIRKSEHLTNEEKLDLAELYVELCVRKSMAIEAAFVRNFNMSNFHLDIFTATEDKRSEMNKIVSDLLAKIRYHDLVEAVEEVKKRIRSSYGPNFGKILNYTLRGRT